MFSGEIGAVMFIVPELVRSIEPILITPAVIRFNSSLVNDNFPDDSLPRSISRALVLGVMVTGEVPPVTETEELISMSSTLNKTPVSPLTVISPSRFSASASTVIVVSADKFASVFSETVLPV